MSEFRREDRYIVFKRKDLAILPKQMQEQLSELTAMVGQWVPSRQYVVVESDWPEYERVFAMIEARMTGQQLNQTIRQVQPLVCPKCNALWLFWPKEQSGFDADTLSVKSAKHCEFCEGASADQLSTLGIAATPAQACLNPMAHWPFAWARPDAVDANQDFRFIKIDDFTVPLYATPPSAVPVVEQLVEALSRNRIMAADSDGNYTKEVTPRIITAAITAGQKYLKENGDA